MGKNHHPTRGSMGFSPRVRSRRHFGHVKAWPGDESSEVRVQGFAGWKAGMTHAFIKRMRGGSDAKLGKREQEVRVPVTVVEVPALRVLGVRGYRMAPYGMQSAGEAWVPSADIEEFDLDLDRRVPTRGEHDQEKHIEALKDEDLEEVRVIVATQPKKITGNPSKTPEMFELNLTGGSISERLEWGIERLGTELEFGDVFDVGDDVDVIGVTKGHGFTGSVKRWGVKLQSHKNSKKRRQYGNLGPKSPGYVPKTARQAGQHGFHQRTELNKRVLRVSNPEEDDVTPAGGFLRYGEVRNTYVLIEGSLPGPSKRLIRFRDAMRPRAAVEGLDVTYVSTASKQGV